MSRVILTIIYTDRIRSILGAPDGQCLRYRIEALNKRCAAKINRRRGQNTIGPNIHRYRYGACATAIFVHAHAQCADRTKAPRPIEYDSARVGSGRDMRARNCADINRQTAITGIEEPQYSGECGPAPCNLTTNRIGRRAGSRLANDIWDIITTCRIVQSRLSALTVSSARDGSSDRVCGYQRQHAAGTFEPG